MAGVLAGIKGGIKLKNAGSSEKSSPSGSSMSPPPPPPVNIAGRAPLAPISSLLHGVNDSRKDVAHIASKKMKQLQWEKVSKAQVSKTLWGQENDETDLVGKIQAVNLWSEMEDEFKAKEILYDAVKRKKETELQSVLASDHRKRIGEWGVRIGLRGGGLC